MWALNKQEIETLINEEAMLLGMYLRDERRDWIPRIRIIAHAEERLCFLLQGEQVVTYRCES